MMVPPIAPARLRQAAIRYDVSTRTLRRWIADGRIKAYGFTPRTLRVDLNELDNLFGVGGAA
ncbi:helix-turn-helix domain-containing protein [Microbacterium sp. ASV81]|uniref:helix-turn-helix domain-containing protein n=1 Tax=Microbacterium capsulatum TaxID=3041921 RepID=UPI0035A30B75